MYFYTDRTANIKKLELKKEEIERELTDLQTLNNTIERAETCYNREFIAIIEYEIKKRIAELQNEIKEIEEEKTMLNDMMAEESLFLSNE